VPREERQEIPTLRQFLLGGSKQHRSFGEAVKTIEIQRLVSAFSELLDRQLDKIVPLDLARWTRRKVQDKAKASSILRMCDERPGLSLPLWLRCTLSGQR
jgi:hypothetical protein